MIDHDALQAQALPMYAAVKEFVQRVEAGEVRSTYTYNKFKEILLKIEVSDEETSR